VLDTSARLLALLGVLQSQQAWSGSELAVELGVSARTIRNDVNRLRSLGYPIEATRGAAGRYRLGAGAKLPPLLLDDNEAVAVAIALRAATGVAGVEASSARALAKLEQVLPHRLTRKVAALNAATSRGPENTTTNVGDPEVHPDVLSAVADAIRDHQQIRFCHEGTLVMVEPYRLVSWQRRWYLVARTAAGADWGTFRLDLIDLKDPGRHFAPQPLVDEDYTSFVLRRVAASGWKVHARLAVCASATDVLSRINAAVGVVEAVDAKNCILVTGADSLETIAVYAGMLGLDFSVTEPAELSGHLAALGERYLRAAGASQPQTGTPTAVTPSTSAAR
jgi:predicted DNA-binding transcriptional regulator YafY